MPPKTRPDPQVLRAAIEQVNSKIQRLREESKKLQEDKRREAGDNSARTARRAITDQIQELKRKTQVAVDAKKEKLTRIRELDDERQGQRAAKDSIEWHSVSEIETEIRKLEYDLETASFSSLRKEKELVSRIRELEAAKHTVRQREQLAAQFSKRSEERSTILAEVKQLQAQIEADRSSIESLRQQLESAKEPTEQSSTRTEAARLAAEIQAAYQEIKKLKDNFEKEREAYNEWEKEEREKKNKEKEEREKARQERLKKIEEERAKKEQDDRKVKREIERIRRLNPKEEEISTIEQLIAYLIALEGQQAKQEHSQAVEFDPMQAVVKPGLVALRKGDDDDWLFKDRSKRKEKVVKREPQIETKKDKRLPLHFAKVQAFEHVGVVAPQMFGQIEDTISKLKQRKAYFDTFRKTQAQEIGRAHV